MTLDEFNAGMRREAARRRALRIAGHVALVLLSVLALLAMFGDQCCAISP